MSTPDTSAYMIAGYSVFFVVMSVYLVSLFLRRRNLGKDLRMLEQVAKPKSAAARATRPAARPGAGKRPGGGAKPGSRKRTTRKSK